LFCFYLYDAKINDFLADFCFFQKKLQKMFQHNDTMALMGFSSENETVILFAVN